MEKNKAKDLLERYNKGLCTPEENAWVETYYNLHANADKAPLSEAELLRELDSIEHSLPLPKRRRISTPAIAAAAAILILALLGWWMYRPAQNKQAPAKPVIAATEVIEPGGNKAILTLSNGKKISLTDANNGNIAKEAGITITKTASGQVVYSIGATANTTENAFNTIETPVGGQYQVELPDGSKIWLNSKSSLRFPVRFSDTARVVTITGEAYFDIAHDKAKPFRVVSDKQTIEVLGTQFNVNAYDDEAAIKTTLLEGKVKISSTILKPGQQAEFTHDAQLTIHNHVNTDDIIAWKNNKIQFTDQDIHTIMRMLARWYNIDVEYTGAAIHTSFGGSVSRSKNIDVILKLLETTGDVHFKIEGRRVTVMP